ncbi:DUF3240 family protein [Seongchinamella sediminis]|uniref:DUF3240 family protein n=1 Tax=Seongchinamella sediminis TaxID=2283635 RepID=UPI0013C3152E|nr:DUF3240 family protein [Seongchinamella sediminis]
MNIQILVAVIPENLRDDVVDALIEMPQISGFGMQVIEGYSREHSQYDLREQVAGHRRMYRLEVMHTQAQEAELLDALQSSCTANPVRYWITPVLGWGHLPGQRHDR